MARRELVVGLHDAVEAPPQGTRRHHEREGKGRRKALLRAARLLALLQYVYGRSRRDKMAALVRGADGAALPRMLGVQENACPDCRVISEQAGDFGGQTANEHPNAEFIFQQRHDVGNRGKTDAQAMAQRQRRFFGLPVDAPGEDWLLGRVARRKGDAEHALELYRGTGKPVEQGDALARIGILRAEPAEARLQVDMHRIARQQVVDRRAVEFGEALKFLRPHLALALLDRHQRRPRNPQRLGNLLLFLAGCRARQPQSFADLRRGDVFQTRHAYPACLKFRSRPSRWCKSAGHDLSWMLARVVAHAAAMRLGRACGSSLIWLSFSRLM